MSGNSDELRLHDGRDGREQRRNAENRHPVPATTTDSEAAAAYHVVGGLIPALRSPKSREFEMYN
jgi:hypothetical protein